MYNKWVGFISVVLAHFCTVGGWVMDRSNLVPAIPPPGRAGIPRGRGQKLS